MHKLFSQLKHINFWTLIILFVIALLTITNYLPGSQIAGDNFPFSANISLSENWVQGLSLWQERGLGVVNLSLAGSLPHLIVYSLLSLALPSATAVYIYIFILATIGVLGAAKLISYALATRIEEKSALPNAIALYYLLSIGGVSAFYELNFTTIVLWTFLPWYLLALFSCFREFQTRSLLYLSVVTLLILPALQDFSLALTLFALSIAYIATQVVSSLGKPEFAKVSRRAMVIIMVSLLSSAAWLLPSLYTLATANWPILETTINQTSGDLLSRIVFLGSVPQTANSASAPEFWTEYAGLAIITVLTIAIFALIVIGVLYSFKTRWRGWYFCALALLCCWIVLADTDLAASFATVLPLLTLLYTLYLGIGAHAVAAGLGRLFKSRFESIVVLIVAVAFVVSAFPALAGYLINRERLVVTAETNSEIKLGGNTIYLPLSTITQSNSDVTQAIQPELELALTRESGSFLRNLLAKYRVEFIVINKTAVGEISTYVPLVELLQDQSFAVTYQEDVHQVIYQVNEAGDDLIALDDYMTLTRPIHSLDGAATLSPYVVSQTGNNDFLVGTTDRIDMSIEDGAAQINLTPDIAGKLLTSNYLDLESKVPVEIWARYSGFRKLEVKLVYLLPEVKQNDVTLFPPAPVTQTFELNQSNYYLVNGNESVFISTSDTKFQLLSRLILDLSEDIRAYEIAAITDNYSVPSELQDAEAVHCSDTSDFIGSKVSSAFKSSKLTLSARNAIGCLNLPLLPSFNNSYLVEVTPETVDEVDSLQICVVTGDTEKCQSADALANTLYFQVPSPAMTYSEISIRLDATNSSREAVLTDLDLRMFPLDKVVLVDANLFSTLASLDAFMPIAPTTISIPLVTVNEEELPEQASIYALPEQLFVPISFLSTLRVSTNENTNSQPSLTVQQTSKILPWLYTATVQGNGYLNLQQSFDAGWQLVGTNGEHLLANSWSNAWFIDVPESTQVTIIYWPQLLQFGGFVLAIITFAGLIQAGMLKRLRIEREIVELNREP